MGGVALASDVAARLRPGEWRCSLWEPLPAVRFMTAKLLRCRLAVHPWSPRDARPLPTPYGNRFRRSTTTDTDSTGGGSPLHRKPALLASMSTFKEATTPLAGGGGGAGEFAG